MKRNKLTALMLALMMAAVMALPGCGTVEETNKQAAEKGEILESAYLVDKETGEFTAVVIVENNAEYMMLENLYVADAYDENGESIEEYQEEEGSITQEHGLSAECFWLDSGEKTALAVSSDMDISSYNFGNKITDYYKAMPETLEWRLAQSYDKQLMAAWGKDLEPHGLSVSECSVDYSEEGYSEYVVALHNDSNTGYSCDPSTGNFVTDTGEFEFELRLVAVFRDTEGNIKDAITMVPMSGQESEIAAGSDSTLMFYSLRSYAEDSEPEYYINIYYLKRVGASDAS